METVFPTISFGEAPFEIIDGDRGVNYPKGDEFSAVGHCLFLNAGNVTDRGFVFETNSFINSDKDTILGKGKLRREDVVLTTRGTVGNVGFYNDTVPFENIRINSGMVILRADPKRIMPKYLFAYLRSDNFKRQVLSLRSGSAQPQLPIRDMRKIRIPLPTIEEQRKIVDVYYSLDDKIELNRRMNATLESMARALFKAWFVDFEPVHANKENRPSTSASPEIAKLFPSDFENGLPIGWSFKPLGEIADVNWGDTSVTKKSYVPEGFPAYSASGSDGFLPYFDFERTGIVVSAIGANSGLTWLARGKWSAIKNTITIFSANDKVSTEYLYLATNGKENWTLRGSAQPFLSQTDTRAKKILFPANSLSKEFGLIAEGFYKLIESNNSETRGLAEIRDALFPRLISGGLRVGEFEIGHTS